MKLTRNLIVYIILNVIAGVIGLIAIKLRWGTTIERTEDSATFSSIVPLIVFIVLALSSVLLMKYDPIRKTRMNLELSYHAATYFIFLTGLIFATVLFPSFRYPLLFFTELVSLMIVAALMLGTHWLIARKRIKGIDARAAFK